MSDIKNVLWVEKYRPQTIDDCILPNELKKTFKQIVSDGKIFNLLLHGTAGLGKTTVAKALCNELNLDWMLINGSEESGIDTLRTKIRQYASTVSLEGNDKPKVVIIDEADYLNAQSTQVALRGFIEEFHTNCRFILTCNIKNRIIEPLHSRCSVISFNTSKKELAKLASRFLKRLKYILDTESIKYDEQTLVNLIIKYAPDWRRVLNECQRYANTGEIPSAILVGMNDQNISTLAQYLKEKNFKEMRIWVAENIDMDSNTIFRSLYDNLYDIAEPNSIPQIVLTLAEYMYRNSFVADKEINMVACLTELMTNQWK